MFWRKKKIITEFTKVRLYQSIEELPVWNWFKLNEEKDLKYLVIGVDYRIFEISRTDFKEAEKVFEYIYDEYMNAFGMTKEFMRLTELQRKIALTTCDLWIDNDKKKKNIIKVLQSKLKRINDRNTGDVNHEKQIVLIEKWLGSTLNTKQISTKKYYTYLDIIQDEADAIKLRKTEKENG